MQCKSRWRECLCFSESLKSFLRRVCILGVCFYGVFVCLFLIKQEHFSKTNLNSGKEFCQILNNHELFEDI